MMLKRYALRHKSTKTAMIKNVVAPPRLSEWTDEIDDAQLFKHEGEAQHCADYIKKVAFNVEVFGLDVNEHDHRITSELHRWQQASDQIHDKHGIERTTVKITE